MKLKIQKFKNSNTYNSIIIAQKNPKYFKNCIMFRKYNLLEIQVATIIHFLSILSKIIEQKIPIFFYSLIIFLSARDLT